MKEGDPHPYRENTRVAYVDEARDRPIYETCCYHNEWVVLSGFTNSCAKGCDYNSAGQHLTPREQWGEETGETANDILMAEAEGFSGEYDG